MDDVKKKDAQWAQHFEALRIAAEKSLGLSYGLGQRFVRSQILNSGKYHRTRYNPSRVLSS